MSFFKIFFIFTQNKFDRNMNIEELRDYCLSFDGVTEKMPFQHFKAAQSICAFYVSGHIFSYEIVKQQYKRKIRSL